PCVRQRRERRTGWKPVLRRRTTSRGFRHPPHPGPLIWKDQSRVRVRGVFFFSEEVASGVESAHGGPPGRTNEPEPGETNTLRCAGWLPQCRISSGREPQSPGERGRP